jgi:hypothetical protein
VRLDVAARGAQEEPRVVRVIFLLHRGQRHGAESCPKRFIVDCESRTFRIRVTVHGNAPFGLRSHSNVSLALLHLHIRQELKLCVTSGHYFSRATCVARSNAPNATIEPEKLCVVPTVQRLHASCCTSFVEYRDPAKRTFGGNAQFVPCAPAVRASQK